MPETERIFEKRLLRRSIALSIGIAVVLGLLWLLEAAVTPLAFAFVLAYLLDPLLDRLEALRVPRSLAVLVLMASALAAFAGGAFWLVPRVQNELAAFSAELPGYFAKLHASVAPFFRETIGLELPDTLRGGIESLREAGLAPPLESAQELLGGALSLFSGTLGAAASLLVMPVIAFYLLVEFDVIKARMVKMIPRPYVDSVVQRVRTVDRLMGGFIRGQLTVCLILGALYALGFSLIGVDLAVGIGFAAGLLAFIPYVGGAIALLSASALCVLEFGFGLELGLVLAWYAAVQTLEGTVLTPRIVGESLGLHPVAVIVALLIGADLLGFLGLLIAVPAAAVVQVFVRDLLEAYRESPLYTGIERS